MKLYGLHWKMSGKVRSTGSTGFSHPVFLIYFIRRKYFRTDYQDNSLKSYPVDPVNPVKIGCLYGYGLEEKKSNNDEIMCEIWGIY